MHVFQIFAGFPAASRALKSIAEFTKRLETVDCRL